jgi:hypothetical protein
MKIMFRPRHNAGKWTTLDERIYANEAELQKFLMDNPDLLPVDVLGEYRRPILVAVREAGLPGSGKTDLIGIDEDGGITIVETKLAANADIKRKVIGQILEYAAYLWKKSYDEFDEIVRRRLSRPLLDLMQDAPKDDEDWSAEEFRSAVAETLRTGRFALFIVVDSVNDELRRTIDFINSRGAADLALYALELKHFSAPESDIVLPQVYGSPEITSRPSRPSWTDKMFRDGIAAVAEPKLRSMLLDLYEFLLATADEVKWGTGKDDGRVACRVRHPAAKDGLVTLFRLRSDGGMKMGFGRLARELPPPESKLAIERLLKDLANPRIQQWYHDVFTPKARGGAAKTGWPGQNRKLTDIFPDAQAVTQFKQAIESTKTMYAANSAQSA